MGFFLTVTEDVIIAGTYVLLFFFFYFLNIQRFFFLRFHFCPKVRGRGGHCNPIFMGGKFEDTTHFLTTACVIGAEG